MEAAKEIYKAHSPAVGAGDKAVECFNYQGNAALVLSKFRSSLEVAFLVGLCIEVGIAYITGEYLYIVLVCNDV